MKKKPKRLTDMNQWGDILYVGQYKKGTYKEYGDFSEDLNSSAIEEIMKKLYFFEENFEVLCEDLNYDK